ncbi:MAG TPA: ECF-type sigma factor [Candidatus Sulfopaludibacter sp.]|jgi:RNA polymerase sigma factor (TIGR02999 family)|nr:ECF-type sigma factor [Candidatus Sulfopaludibacter sp.]
MVDPSEPNQECSLDEITAAVYGELRRLAGGYLHRDGGGLTLQPTALVHEAYLKMARQDRLHWRNRGHFFGIAARCMRQILVDHARARGATKRGGHAVRADAEEMLRIGSEPEAGIQELDDALEAFSRIDARKSQMVELCYFGGLDHDEIGEVLEISASTVKRELKVARAWLMRELGSGR